MPDAPFVYFDHVPTYGTLSGAIEVELGARYLAPSAEEVTPVNVLVAHLRTSPDGARALIAALEKALGLTEAGSSAPVGNEQLN